MDKQLRGCYLLGRINVVAKVANAMGPVPLGTAPVLKLLLFCSISYHPRICYFCYRCISVAALHYKQNSQSPVGYVALERIPVTIVAKLH